MDEEKKVESETRSYARAPGAPDITDIGDEIDKAEDISVTSGVEGSDGMPLTETVEVPESKVEPGIPFGQLVELLRRAYHMPGVVDIRIELGKPVMVTKLVLAAEILANNPHLRPIETVPESQEPKQAPIDFKPEEKGGTSQHSGE